jgi:two-component system chemotaxis response regulator CheY
MARTLIVDDAAFMRASLKFILEKAGHQIVGEAENGRQALDIFTRLTPDIVPLMFLWMIWMGVKY